jgi:hypothetical protein
MSCYITSRKNEERGRLRAFLKDPLLIELGITQLDHKPAKNNAGVAQGTHLKEQQ